MNTITPFDPKRAFYEDASRRYQNAYDSIRGIQDMTCPTGMTIWEAGNISQFVVRDIKRMDAQLRYLSKMANPDE